MIKTEFEQFLNAENKKKKSLPDLELKKEAWLKLAE
jgi:hypothetical protein